MSSDLFRQIVESRSSSPRSRLSALPVSILAHVLVLAAVVVIPLLASDILPLVRSTEILDVPVLVRVVPPTIPAPLAPRAPAPEMASATAAPVDSPNGIGREQMVQAEPLPDTSAPAPLGEVTGTVLPAGIGLTRPETPPPAPSQPVRPGPLIKTPIKVRDVSPVYPPMALAAHVQGVVVVEAVIGPTGEVVQARILRSKPLLDEAALEAVRQWRYTPTLVNGTPVSVILTVTVTFSLQ